MAAAFRTVGLHLLIAQSSCCARYNEPLLLLLLLLLRTTFFSRQKFGRSSQYYCFARGGHFRIVLVFCPFSREKIGINLNMASGDSQIDKPQRGRPKRAELPNVNINTDVQSSNTERPSLNSATPLFMFTSGDVIN